MPHQGLAKQAYLQQTSQPPPLWSLANLVRRGTRSIEGGASIRCINRDTASRCKVMLPAPALLLLLELTRGGRGMPPDAEILAATLRSAAAAKGSSSPHSCSP